MHYCVFLASTPRGGAPTPVRPLDRPPPSDRAPDSAFPTERPRQSPAVRPTARPTERPTAPPSARPLERPFDHSDHPTELTDRPDLSGRSFGCVRRAGPERPKQPIANRIYLTSA